VCACAVFHAAFKDSSYKSPYRQFEPCLPLLGGRTEALWLRIPGHHACSCFRSHTAAVSEFGGFHEIRLKLPTPYLRDPLKCLNKIGLPEKPYYRTEDARKVLGISPYLLRYRFTTGRYPEVARDGKGHVSGEKILRI
jgi:hypothetical protein